MFSLELEDPAVTRQWFLQEIRRRQFAAALVLALREISAEGLSAIAEDQMLRETSS